MQSQQDSNNQVVDTKMPSYIQEQFYTPPVYPETEILDYRIEEVARERARRTITFQLIELMKTASKPCSTDYLIYEIAKRQDSLLRPDGTKYKGTIEKTVLGALSSLHFCHKNANDQWIMNEADADEYIKQVVKRLIDKEKKRKRQSSLNRVALGHEIHESKTIEVLKAAFNEETLHHVVFPDPFGCIAGTETETELINILGQEKFEYLLQFFTYFSGYLFFNTKSVLIPSVSNPIFNVHDNNTSMTTIPAINTMNSITIEPSMNPDSTESSTLKRRKIDTTFSVDGFPSMEDPNSVNRYPLSNNYWRAENNKKDSSKNSMSVSNNLLLDSLPSSYSVSHMNMYSQSGSISHNNTLPSLPPMPLNTLSMSNMPSLPPLPSLGLNTSVSSSQPSQSMNNSLPMQTMPMSSYSSQYQYPSLPVVNPIMSGSMNLQPVLPSYKSSSNSKDPTVSTSIQQPVSSGSLDYTEEKTEENKTKTSTTDPFSLPSISNDLPLLMQPHISTSHKDSEIEVSHEHASDTILSFPSNTHTHETLALTPNTQSELVPVVRDPPPNNTNQNEHIEEYHRTISQEQLNVETKQFSNPMISSLLEPISTVLNDSNTVISSSSSSLVVPLSSSLSKHKSNELQDHDQNKIHKESNE